MVGVGEFGLRAFEGCLRHRVRLSRATRRPRGEPFIAAGGGSLSRPLLLALSPFDSDPRNGGREGGHYHAITSINLVFVALKKT